MHYFSFILSVYYFHNSFSLSPSSSLEIHISYFIYIYMFICISLYSSFVILSNQFDKRYIILVCCTRCKCTFSNVFAWNWNNVWLEYSCSLRSIYVCANTCKLFRDMRASKKHECLKETRKIKQTRLFEWIKNINVKWKRCVSLNF